MFRPSLSQAQAFVGSFARVPVSLEIYADTDTTIGLLSKLEKRADCHPASTRLAAQGLILAL